MPEMDDDFEADLAATLAEMEAEGEGPDGEEETEQEETDTESEGGELEGDEEELDEDGDEEEEQEDDLDSEDAGPDLSAAQAALDSGDLEALAKALGREPEAFDVSKRQFRAMRAGLADAKAARKAAETAKAQADQVSEAAQKTYGPIVLARKAVASKASGWQGQARAALEMIGFTPDVLGQLVGDGTDGSQTPAEETEVDKLRRELRERDERLEQERAQAAQAEEIKAQEAEVLQKLVGTPLAGREHAAAEIVRLVRASYDQASKGYGLTVKEAYKQVKAKYVIGEQPAAKPGKKKVRKRLARQERVERKQKELTPEEELQRDIAEAQREAEAEERAMRRARGSR